MFALLFSLVHELQFIYGGIQLEQVEPALPMELTKLRVGAPQARWARTS